MKPKASWLWLLLLVPIALGLSRLRSDVVVLNLLHPDSPDVQGSAPSFGEGEELFASADGTFRMLFVEAKPDTTSYKQCRAWLEDINAVVEEARRRQDIPAQTAIRYTGRPAFVAEIASGMEHD